MNVKSRTLFGVIGISMLLVTSGAAVARDNQRPRGAEAERAAKPHTRTTERQRTENGRTRNVDYTGPEGNTGSVDRVRTKTDDGFTRSTTVTNAQGETATRDLTVTRDKESDTVTREANYTTPDGRAGGKTGVIQRTDDGYTRDTTHTLPDGSTHTRAVDVSCDKDAKKCVRQVEVGKEP